MRIRFPIRFPAVAVISALAVTAPSIPRSRGGGDVISIPLTKRSPMVNSNENAGIDGLRSRTASSMAKLLHSSENYERNTRKTHPSAWAGLDLTTGPNDEDWYGTILIGTPPRSFTVQIDTGSSDLFIPASTGDANCKSHDNLWNPDSSETAKDLNKPFELNFGDGANAKGKQYTDTITIAGFTADKQTIGLATTYSAGLEKSAFPADGLLGLAFPSFSKYPASPLLQTLVSEGKLQNAVLSFKLASDGGEMCIGGVNEELYIGDITFVDVQTMGLWEVIVDDFRVNGRPILTRVTSIIDTGANFIYGDPDRVLKLHQAHGGKAFQDGWYTFPCDDFPDVTLTFGGQPFTISADQLDYGPVEDGSPDCFSGILAHFNNNAGLLNWSIGTNFLQLYYTVLNMGSDPPQVGFAHFKESSESSEVS